MEDDYYRADLEKYEVIGQRKGRRIRLGDRVRVQLINVSLESGEIDLRLVEDTRVPKPKPKMRQSRVRQRRRR